MSKQTALYHKHVALGAKMVPFAGYEMPVQYHSMINEHKRVRTTVGVFDVSHMGELEVSGPNALSYVQKLTLNDAAKLAPGKAQYSAMCKPDGGIVDDLLVYQRADSYLLVINAANIDKDYAWAKDNLIDGMTLENTSDFYTQLAVQGPDSVKTLQKLTKVNLDEVQYYTFVEDDLAGVKMIISRTGYTGETGFELYFDQQYSEKVWDAIFTAGAEYDIEPIGLGARDTLRLEKCFALYGNDIDETTSPLEARLGWITKFDKGDFNGKDFLAKQKEAGITRRLSGFMLDGKGFPRHGYEVFDGGQKIGYVTSGTVSPMLNKGIGMAYLDKPYDKIDTKIEIDVRGKRLPATVIKMPFL
jgi:aminomethyltransferase